MGMPWGLLWKAETNMAEAVKARQEAEKNAQTNQDPSMQYDSAPAQSDQDNRGIQMTSTIANATGVGSDFAKSMPLAGQAMQTESQMGVSSPAIGGYSVQPLHFDSSQQPYNSNMASYLRYLRYRGY